MDLPNLQKFGLGNIIDILGVPPVETPEASYGKMAEKSPAKDSTVGHWEIMSFLADKPLPTYPRGFPVTIVTELSRKTGKKFIGNIAASGTEIISVLGDEHVETGALILYTSADSVMQFAAHEEIVPLKELYDICEIARNIMTGIHNVGRIIARPFSGKSGNYQRTLGRHDYSITAPDNTVLDLLYNAGIPTISVGKIFDLFGGRGISEAHKTFSNFEGIMATIDVAKETSGGLIFTNLVDFDMLCGHRNDPAAFYRGLVEFDYYLPDIVETLDHRDILILTADHGVDPTTVSTDHSREYVPLLVYSPSAEKSVNLGTRSTFSDVGATVAEFFDIKTAAGASFLKDVIKF